MELTEILNRYEACGESMEWLAASGFNMPGTLIESAWISCNRGDWMLWICGKIGIDRKSLVVASCACARLALKFVKEGEDRPLKAIEAAEGWTRGEVSIRDVKEAAYAVASSATSSSASYASYASSLAVAYASSAASSSAASAAAYAAASASSYAASAASSYAADAAASAAAYAAAYAAADAARVEMLKACAIEVRQHITLAMIAACVP